MKKVYFACSIAGGRDHSHTYQDIVSYIKASGVHVLSELFADGSIKPEEGTKHQLTPRGIWEWDVNWVKEADFIIAEVTQPSLGVGYEIAIAEGLKKPILALFYKDSGRRLSSMVAGNPHVQVFEYSDIKQTKAIIKKFLS